MTSPDYHDCEHRREAERLRGLLREAVEWMESAPGDKTLADLLARIEAAIKEGDAQ